MMYNRCLNVNHIANSPSKEGQGGVIAREGDGLNLLGCKGHCDHGLLSERPNYQQKVLCQLTVQYYSTTVLRQLQKAIKPKPLGKLMKAVHFYQDNAPAHKSLVAIAAVHNLLRTDWSPSIFCWMAPLDNFLCSNMKKTLSWEALWDPW